MVNRNSSEEIKFAMKLGIETNQKCPFEKEFRKQYDNYMGGTIKRANRA